MNFEYALCTAVSVALMLLLKALTLEEKNINNMVINSYNDSKARVRTAKWRFSEMHKRLDVTTLFYN